MTALPLIAARIDALNEKDILDLYAAMRAFICSEVAVSFAVLDGFAVKQANNEFVSESLQDDLKIAHLVRVKTIKVMVDLGQWIERMVHENSPTAHTIPAP